MIGAEISRRNWRHIGSLGYRMERLANQLLPALSRIGTPSMRYLYRGS